MSEISEVGQTELFDKETYEKHVRGKENVPSFVRQLDYIPLISIISGLARMIFGAMEFILGIFTSVFEILYDVSTGRNHQFLIVQGCANTFRGFVALVPIAGNIALYLYDHNRIVIQH